LRQLRSEIFLQMGLDRLFTDLPVGQISRAVRGSAKSESGRRSASFIVGECRITLRRSRRYRRGWRHESDLCDTLFPTIKFDGQYGAEAAGWHEFRVEGQIQLAQNASEAPDTAAAFSSFAFGRTADYDVMAAIGWLHAKQMDQTARIFFY
jgi:hypothetical protein